MTTASMESCWYAPDSVASKWRNSSDTVPAPYNTGSTVLRKAVLQVFRKPRGLVALAPWTKAFARISGGICADPPASWDTPRTSGTGNSSVITWLKDSGFTWESANANVCSDNWGFEDVNHALSLLNPIRKRSGDIKKLRRLAAREDLDLWFEDECHFQQHGSRCAMWIPPEDVDPVVLHAPTRKSLGIFGAVSANTGRLVVSQENKFDAMTFLSFLKQLLQHRRKGRTMLVILDNARWHHAKALRPWLRKHRHVLRLDFLPPNSPDLNPIERVWKLTRSLCTHNRYFPVLEELGQAIFNQFGLWRKPNETLRRLCAII